MRAPKLAFALGVCLSLGIGPARASVIVDATVTDLGGGVFHYTLSVTNSELSDLAVVSIMDAPLSDPLIDPSLVTPPGFLASYDDGLGIIDFIADVSSFGPGTTTSGFSFDSFWHRGSYFSAFSALTILGESIEGAITYATPVPEPESLALLGLGFSGLALARRRRR
jgi:hypothetical protein